MFGSRDMELEGGVLKLRKELEYDYDIVFDRACTELITGPEKDLVIDLSYVTRITSTYIGVMAAAFFQAKANGKNISVIAHGSVLNTLKRAGFAHFMKLTDSQRLTAHPG